MSKSRIVTHIAEPAAPVRIELACGQNKEPGWIGVDAVKTSATDHVADLLRFPWRFAKPGTVDEIRCSHFVEHIPHRHEPPNDLFFEFFDECYKLLKVGGKMTVICPYVTSRRAFQDPTHHRFITDASFLYLDKNWRVANKLDHYPVSCDFAMLTPPAYMVDNSLTTRVQEVRDLMVKTQWDAVMDIHAFLTKR